MNDLQSLVLHLLDLCREAGQQICAHYNAPGAAEYQSKGDDSPLTQADLASDRVLTAGLRNLHDSLPVLSEESAEADVAQRLNWQRYWLIDPLDGTKEFLARTGEFTINIALIESHRPALGVLYLPLTGEAYVGIPGTGAWRYGQNTGGEWVRVDIAARALEPDRPLRVLASRRHRGAKLQDCLDWLQRQWGALERSNSGSALKFCHLAAGQGDVYPRFARCCEWDTAAGDALLEAAGGAVLGLDGEPLRYNLGESLYSPPFYALADPSRELWQRLLARQ